MALRGVVRRLRTTTDELDRGKRVARRAALGCTPIDELHDRQPADVVGEVTSVKIVPRAGASSLEVTIDDGHALAVAIFYGRKHIAGLHAGGHVRLAGRVRVDRGRTTLINPAYELLD